jgi:hypothetical protein
MHSSNEQTHSAGDGHVDMALVKITSKGKSKIITSETNLPCILITLIDAFKLPAAIK